MPSQELTPHDNNVLQKINDPESTPSRLLLVDASLPRDPHISNSFEYESATSSERQIILRVQQLESHAAAALPNSDEPNIELVNDYRACIAQLDSLISRFPKYASAYNNKVQALRRLYGDSVFLKTKNPLPSLLIINNYAASDEDITLAAATILSHLETAISLLSPCSPFVPISAQAAKTLSQAYTQRGALFHITAKQLTARESGTLRLHKNWTKEDLEDMASKDFAMGGRYGNEVARGLVVATNPTAKLCGNIVREAIRKEFGGLGT